MTSDEDRVNAENPFEVSRVLGDNLIFQKPYASPYDFDLEGSLVVCGSHLILPPICVYTGVTEDLVEIQRHTVFPSMKLVINQRSCNVITYVTRSERYRRAKFMLIFGTICVLGFAMIMAPILLRWRQLAILLPVGIVATALSVLLLNRWNMPLQLVRYKAPGIYWVRGFSKAFLAQLAMYKVNDIGRTSQLKETDTKLKFEI